MNIQITYSELEDIIRCKSGQQLQLSFSDERTISVSKSLKILFVHKRITVALSVLHIEGSDIVFTYRSGHATDLILQGALTWFKDSLKGVMEHPNGTNRLIVHLAAIPQLETALNVILLKDITFDHENTNVKLEMKGLRD